jgi:anti-sigma-K factor RskA
MSLSPEDELNAAEFAIGTLDATERASLAARRQREWELDQAIVSWELRLAPLAEAVPPAAPPRDYLADIEAQLDRPPTNDGLATLSRAVRRWRAAAIGAGSIAAALAVGLVAREMTRTVEPREFVAVLQKGPDQPAFIVTVNLDARSFTVRPVAAPPEVGKSYELWIIDAKLGAPRSLGVIDQSAVTANDKLGAYDPAVVQDATYAVTIEPTGGSPTGKPSGPPVFVGKLIPTGR